MAKVIMIQGTMSNAGKSFVAAGLCRVFRQDGYRVAPFKSQNMALNSYVTSEGLEMGRAQVMQAEAAGIEPSVDMNPILLKPTSDVGSQVIVNGIARGNMDARAYFDYKKQLVPDIEAAFSRLSKKADIIVVEGAGSPAEINLKENDIVNMGLAKILGAPVLLVGNIDPGGVFAQLVGTVDLLEPEERSRVKGFIINQFRGDPSLLTSGITMLTEKTGIPTLGILPYIHISLDDEDSLSGRLDRHAVAGRIEKASKDDTGEDTNYLKDKGNGSTDRSGVEPKKTTPVDLAVIRLPHISNFTDFDVFDMVPDCRVRYVSSPDELAGADMVILPGTKNTVDDLRWLWRSGLADAVRQFAAEGKPVWGICGGYQMLGISVRDPDHVETKEGEMAGADGLALLPIRTVLRKSKILEQVEGFFVPENGTFAPLSGLKIQGYEIHNGSTEKVPPAEWPTSYAERQGTDGAPFVSLHNKKGHSSSMSAGWSVSETNGIEYNVHPERDGLICGNVCGSYVHGIFDADGVAEKLVEILMRQVNGDEASLKSQKWFSTDTKRDTANDRFPAAGNYHEFKERQYDLLADMIRSNMDMDAVYGCLAESCIH